MSAIHTYQSHLCILSNKTVERMPQQLLLALCPSLQVENTLKMQMIISTVLMTPVGGRDWPGLFCALVNAGCLGMLLADSNSAAV